MNINRIRQVRTIEIVAKKFNFNAYTDEECLMDFCFRQSELPISMKIIRWDRRRTKRNGYVCDSITATCLSARRLSSPCRWADLEKMFDMHTSALIKIFYGTINELSSGKKHLMTKVRHDLHNAQTV